MPGDIMKTTHTGMMFALALILGGCDYVGGLLHPAPAIKFAAYGPDYQARPDFAQIEYEFPLGPAELKKLDPQNMKNYDQEQIDQIYARLSAGPIPDGAFDGGLFFPKGVNGDRRIAEVIGGLPGPAVEMKVQKIEVIGQTLWKGKVFFNDQRVLRNPIEGLVLPKPLIDCDFSNIPPTTVARRDQWPMV